MKKQNIYRYLANNGIMESPLLFEELPHVVRYRLFADNGKILVNGDLRRYIVNINVEDIDNWHEEPDDMSDN